MGQSLQAPRPPFGQFGTSLSPFLLPNEGFSEISSVPVDRSWGVARPYSASGVSRPAFDSLTDEAKEAVYSGLQRTPWEGTRAGGSAASYTGPSAQSILDEARGVAAGLEDTAIRPPSPKAPSIGFQPGGAAWRQMSQQMVSPWEGSVPLPRDPLAAAPSRVFPSWNAPFGAGSGPIGDGSKISSRVNLLGSIPERNAIAEKLQSAGASSADDIAEAMARSVAAAAPAEEIAAANAARAAGRGMLGRLPWGEIGIGAGAALGAGLLAKALIGGGTQVAVEALNPNDVADGGLNFRDKNPEMADRFPRDQTFGMQTLSSTEVPSMFGSLPSPEELPGMSEEPEMSMDGDEPPPVVPTEAPITDMHTINKGDTLSGLLLGMGVSREELPRIIGEIGRGNNINPDVLVPGQQIDFLKRAPGPDYRYKRPAQLGGTPSIEGRGRDPGASVPLGPLAEGMMTGGGYSPGAPNYDAVMGPNRRPPPGEVVRWNNNGASFEPAPRRAPEMPPHFPAGGPRRPR